MGPYATRPITTLGNRKRPKGGELQTKVSNSELTAWQECHRRWWFEWFRDLRTVDGGASAENIGNLEHKALEYYYKQDSNIDPLAAMRALADRMIANAPGHREQIEADYAIAEKMFERYKIWVSEEYVDHNLVFTATEQQIEVPLGQTGFTLTGRPDARGTRKMTGARVVMDNKTVDRFERLERNAQLNQQFKTYSLLEFLLSKGEPEPIDGLIINMLRRVDVEHQDSKPPYFKRYEIRYNVDELRNHYRHIIIWSEEIQKARRQLAEGVNHQVAVPPSPGMVCEGCKFRLVCPSFDDGSDAEALVSQYYRVGIHGEWS